MSPSKHPTSRNDSSDLSLRDLMRGLRRRWALFCGTAAGVVAFVMLVTFLMAPVYESEASLQVREEQGGAASFASGLMGGLEDALPIADLGLPGMGRTDVPTEIGLLGSRRILETVADTFSLHVNLQRPRGTYRTDVLQVLDGAREDAPRGVFSLRRESDGTYSVSARGTRRPVELPGSVVLGTPFSVGPMRMMLDAALASEPPELVRFEVRPFRRAVQSFRESIKIEREDTGSRLISIRYRHSDPYLARAVVNRIADDFMDYSVTVSKSDSRREREILAEQTAAASEELAAAERRLQAYQEEKRIIAPEEQAEAQVLRIAELQVTHDALEVEREALTELLAEVSARHAATVDDDAAPSGGRGGDESAYRQLATFPSLISNGSIESLLQTLTALENQRAELRTRRTDQNLDVVMVLDRIREVETQLFTISTNYLEGLQMQIRSSEQALARFGSELEAIPEVEIEYARLARERRLLGEAYLALQMRLMQTRVQEEIDNASVRQVDFGVIEDRPAFPRPAISLVLSGMLGMMLGLFAVVLAETTNPYARTRREVETATGVRVLASVPRRERGSLAGRVLAARPARPGSRGGNGGIGTTLPRTPAPGGKGRKLLGRSSAHGALVLQSDPWHRAAEEYRALALTLIPAESAPRTLVVTSPGNEEDRGAVAGNLALALAGQGTRTILVDIDVEDASLASRLGTPVGPGWPEIAFQDASFDEVVHEVAVGDGRTPLHFLRAGEESRHPLEILASAEARSFLSSLAGRYDVVILITRPLGSGHDALVLGARADGVVLVARSGKTGKEALEDSAERFRQAGIELAGVVLDEVESAGH